MPSIRPIHDRLALEIARGCTRGCRFCQAGFLYRPVRERRPSDILDTAQKALDASGLDEASFLSLSAGDYTCLTGLMTAFMDAHQSRRTALSLPSLRVKSLTPEMMRQIKRVRKTGFTLAPEAGSQRLRDVINKDLTEADLLTAARDAFRLGWRLIKLYFMIGLPTETEADVLAIADLAEKVRAGARGKVNVSFAAFVPKAHTPFQWEAMLSLEGIRERLELLKSRLRRPGLQPKWNQAESSVLEGVLARGDRRLGPVIQRIFERGGRFDAWNDRLRYDLWLEELDAAGLEMNDYLRAREADEVLPWDHLSSGVSREYLWAEREKSRSGTATPDCRDGACGACGVCDFKTVSPRLRRFEESPPPAEPTPEASGEPVGGLIRYAKDGPARYLSHLETVAQFYRAFRRAGLNLRMSQGFHPQPRMVFATPLSVGLASRDEYLTIHLIDPPEAEEITRRLAGELLPGLEILSVVLSRPPRKPPVAAGARFRIESEVDCFYEENLAEALSREELPVDKPGKKGLRRVDLKTLLSDIKVLTPRRLELTLLTGPYGSVRPELALQALFGPQAPSRDLISVLKLETMLE